MRVFQVTAPAPFGGLERVVQALVAGQSARGHEVHVVSVVSPGDTGTPFHAPFRAAGIEVHTIEVAGRDFLRERREFRELCRRVRPDIVHTHGGRPEIVESGVARGLRVPTVATVHAKVYARHWKARIAARLFFFALRRYDAVVAVSRALADDLRGEGVPPEIISALANAFYETSAPLSRIEARRALGIAGDAVVAGCVGRVTHQKALDVAMSAVALLKDIPVALSLVGDGEERAMLEAHATALGIADLVTWHGARTGAHELMRAFDLLLLSSRWEGTPITLLEAMAAGVPVVATTVGGVPDVVSPREAMLVAPDDPIALAAAIRSVVTDLKAAAGRAEAARVRIRDEFGMEKWIAHHDVIYERAIERCRLRS